MAYCTVENIKSEFKTLKLIDDDYPLWVADTAYIIGDKIQNNGIIYTCLIANSDTTFTESNWTNGGAISTTDKGITISDVQSYIDQESATIDGQIANCYVLPLDIVDPLNVGLFNALKKVCIFLVAERLEPILQVKSKNSDLNQNGDGYVSYYIKAKGLLNKICPSKGNTLIFNPAAEIDSSESNTDYEFDTEVTDGIISNQLW